MTLFWVTSFSPDIYRATGKEMVESFIAKDIDDRLLMFPENMNGVALPTTGKVKRMPDLSADQALAAWLERNADIIPVDKGGRWKGPCFCRKPGGRKEQDHKMPCPGAWFCRNASRWFRKVAAIRQALAVAAVDDIVIWADCDIRFVARPTRDQIAGWFGGRDVFHLKGPKRKHWESGVLGFRGPKAREFFDTVWTRYNNGKFRADARWDDGFQFGRTSVLCPTVKFIDLANGASGHMDVVPHSPLAQVLIHRKGEHSRVLKIVT